MLKLRDYQIDCANKAIPILKKYGIVYLAMEVRTGKTVTAFETAKLLGAKKVIFTTKKKAIKGIKDDYKDFGYDKHFELIVINNESLHLIPDNDFDLLISDEHHRAGAFPRPTKIAKDLKMRFGRLPIICLSGTPHPESYSQIYHQFWIRRGFWKKHRTFYKWFKEFGDSKKRHFGYAEVNVYTDLNKKGELLVDSIRKILFITYTQEEAGFETSVNKQIVYCHSEPKLIDYCKTLSKHKTINIGNHTIEADTAVKLQNKIHQISNGTVIDENGNTLALSDFKARFIQEYFKGKKLAIFYYYRAEWQILKSVFGDSLTDDLEEFQNTDKNIALQQISGSEGISLKEADALVYYNFGFSNVKFTQGIDRLTTMNRKNNDVYFVFSRGSINERIYNTIVYKKQDYILSAFKKDFDIPYNYNKL